MNKIHKECEKCFELHKLDCAGQTTDKKLNCYLHSTDTENAEAEKIG